MKTINENGTFRKRSPEWNVLKTLCLRAYVDRRKRNFSEKLGTHYQFQSTPRNIKNLFKIAVGRFPFLSFILELISNLSASFQANLALLILQADYTRGRQNIIRLLSLPVSRGGRLDLPLVRLCFCPGFDILNCFCDFEERHKNINPLRGGEGGGGKVSQRKSVVQSACQYDVTSRVSNFQNGEQSVHPRDG